jgi:NADH-quinone oxidoreductase subunit L
MQNTLSKKVPDEDAAITGFTKVLYDKYYVDEIYDFYS